jgi:hypothetical protein
MVLVLSMSHISLRHPLERLQNTDPFVFGKQFHYTRCQQRTKEKCHASLTPRCMGRRFL